MARTKKAVVAAAEDATKVEEAVVVDAKPVEKVEENKYVDPRVGYTPLTVHQRKVIAKRRAKEKARRKAARKNRK